MRKKFDLGQVVATPGAIEALNKFGFRHWQFEITPYLDRHQSGDWGEVSPEDAKENDFSVKHNYRLLSAYTVGDTKVWVITEHDRSVTTLLLPSEY